MMVRFGGKTWNCLMTGCVWTGKADVVFISA
jgi:hypothetical protein